ncbi:hypothetical protein FQA47_015726 [Oryzias melastigma]|uniref:Uncharacterized protein n=1 Tax=Oryzias melastigma TaxID=30732 RepID=A0A834F3X3_ORYME|nr:hypothetical protein FQA47_015726 [Oryzias melastigma]
MRNFDKQPRSPAYRENFALALVTGRVGVRPERDTAVKAALRHQTLWLPPLIGWAGSHIPGPAPSWEEDISSSSRGKSAESNPRQKTRPENGSTRASAGLTGRSSSASAQVGGFRRPPPGHVGGAAGLRRAAAHIPAAPGSPDPPPDGDSSLQNQS